MKFAKSVLVASILGAVGLSAQAQQGPIKIGILSAFSGTYAGIGQQNRWAHEMAAREINAAGGILGRKIELVFEDEEANPAVATQKAEKLYQVDKVEFITGIVSSGSSLAVSQVAERNKKFASTSVSYADSITGDRCSPNFFRASARAYMQSAALASWLSKARPNASVFFSGPDYEMGRSSVAAIKAATTALGAKAVGEAFTPTGAQDYSTYFGQIRAAKPNVIYMAQSGNDAVRMLTQLNEFGLAKGVTFIGSAGAITGQNIGAAGKSAEGFVTGVGYSPELDNPENKKFVAAFRAAYKADPDVFGADAYGVLYLYKAAVEKAGSVDTDRVRTALKDLKWSTPQGVKTMRGGDHQAMQEMYAVQIQSGQFKVIGRVAPEDAVGPDMCTRF